LADFYPSVRWIFVEKRVPAAYREVLACSACVAVLVREVGGCFIECGRPAARRSAAWRAGASEELDALLSRLSEAHVLKRLRRRLRFCILAARRVRSLSALREIGCRSSNILLQGSHRSIQGGGNFRSSPPSSCTLFSSLIGPVTVGLLKRYITTPIQL